MTKNTNMKGSGTLQAQIIKTMEETAEPTDLWSVTDIMDALGITKQQADNAFFNAWKTNKIYRHKINGDTDSGYVGFSRFALKIKEADRKPYVPQNRALQSGGKSYSKRRGTKLTAKEIRQAFMEVQNAMVRLEDMIMPIIEEAEDKDKVLDKLKNML